MKLTASYRGLLSACWLGFSLMLVLFAFNVTQTRLTTLHRRGFLPFALLYSFFLGGTFTVGPWLATRGSARYVLFCTASIYTTFNVLVHQGLESTLVAASAVGLAASAQWVIQGTYVARLYAAGLGPLGALNTAYSTLYNFNAPLGQLVTYLVMRDSTKEKYSSDSRLLMYIMTAVSACGALFLLLLPTPQKPSKNSCLENADAKANATVRETIKKNFTPLKTIKLLLCAARHPAVAFVLPLSLFRGAQVVFTNAHVPLLISECKSLASDPSANEKTRALFFMLIGIPCIVLPLVLGPVLDLAGGKHKGDKNSKPAAGTRGLILATSIYALSASGALVTSGIRIAFTKCEDIVPGAGGDWVLLLSGLLFGITEAADFALYNYSIGAWCPYELHEGGFGATIVVSSASTIILSAASELIERRHLIIGAAAVTCLLYLGSLVGLSLLISWRLRKSCKNSQT